MKWIRLITTIYVLFGCGYIYAQNGAVTGFCVKGATPAITSGSSSTNTLQGIVPGGPAGCLVQVYLTGTVTPATIYPNVGGGTLNNPFRASLSGQWLFYASTTQAYDVVLSGGVPPNVYTSPVTLTGIPAGGGSGDPNAVTIATPFTVADSIAISAGAGRGIVSTNLSYDIGSNNLFNSSGVFNITDAIIHGSVFDGGAISNSSIGDSSPQHGTFDELNVIGQTATSILNQPSAVLSFISSQWNGSAPVAIQWNVQSIPSPSSGIGTLDTLTFSHGGASSSYNVSIPNLNVTGGVTSTFNGTPYVGINTATASGNQIAAYLGLCPNLATGINSACALALGVDQTANDFGALYFRYAGTGSLSNYLQLSIASGAGVSPKNGFCVDANGNAAVNNTMTNSICGDGVHTLTVSGTASASDYFDSSLISAPFVSTDSSGKLTAGTGFTGTKTAGSCVITIVSGIITNVTGC